MLSLLVTYPHVSQVKIRPWWSDMKWAYNPERPLNDLSHLWQLNSLITGLHWKLGGVLGLLLRCHFDGVFFNAAIFRFRLVLVDDLSPWKVTVNVVPSGWVLLWVYLSGWVFALWPHLSQVKIRPLWVDVTCSLKVDGWQNDLSHCLQSNFLIWEWRTRSFGGPSKEIVKVVPPGWLLRCLFLFSYLTVRYPHMSQMKTLPLWVTLICFRNVCLWENTISHLLHWLTSRVDLLGVSLSVVLSFAIFSKRIGWGKKGETRWRENCSPFFESENRGYNCLS